MQMSFWLSLVSTEYNICKPKPRNDFCEIGILSQSQIGPFSNPRTTARGKCCKEHFFFILSRNLIGQRETKVIRSQFTISSAQVHRFTFSRDKQDPEICLHSQVINQAVMRKKWILGFLWFEVSVWSNIANEIFLVHPSKLLWMTGLSYILRLE